MEERIPYKQGAKVGKPVAGEDLPARPQERQTSLEPEGQQRTGPGVRNSRAENVRARERWDRDQRQKE